MDIGSFILIFKFIIGDTNYALSSSGDRIEEPLVSIGRFSNYNSDESVTETDIVYPDFMTQLNELYIPVNPSPTNVDRDDLIEYRVYSVDENDNETFVVATNDTFATVSASPNYLEYCYNISAYWATDNYGDLESRHSNIACSVPF